MKKWIQVAAMALVASSVTLADRAEGKEVRNPIERRTNPEDGFFVSTSSSSTVVKTQTPTSHGRIFYTNPFQSFWKTLQAPKKSSSSSSRTSWGWQRGSRAEYHHPGPRGRR